MIFSNKTLEIIRGLNKIEPFSVIEIKVFANNTTYSYSLGNQKNLENGYFQIGSNTKLYTASLISKYIFEGKINVCDSIDKYLELPKGKNYPTIENLLTHHGYRPFISLKIIFNRIFRRKSLSKNMYSGYDSNKLLSYLAHKKPPKKLFYFYSDINFAILGLIIEKISGNSYVTAMTNFIENDLKLNETTFKPIGKITNCYYRKKQSHDLKWDENDIFIAAGGLYQTPDDSLKFCKLCLNEKLPYLNETLIKRKTVLFKNLKMGIGYGWFSYTSGNYFYHKGAVSHFRTNLFVDKEKQNAVAILTNMFGNRKFNSTSLGVSIHKDIKNNIRFR